jgi:hypothetical protein
MSTKPPTQDYNSVTVTNSFAVARPDGRYAMVLVTLEQGAIAFEMNATAIRFLRRELDAVEAMMKQPRGNA